MTLPIRVRLGAAALATLLAIGAAGAAGRGPAERLKLEDVTALALDSLAPPPRDPGNGRDGEPAVADFGHRL